MGITLKDIYEQRDMLRRGKEIARAAKQAEERERLRDHFAAAALTGLLAQGDDGAFSEESYARAAYRWADAMLRERERTFDAKPRELSDDQKTLRNAADLLGPGGFKNLANELLSLSRRLADKSYAKSCKKCNSSHTGRDADDRPEPIKDAESDRPQPIATGDTPAAHATPGEGSTPREGTEPVAWATFYPNGSTASVYAGRQPPHAEPLYRHPPCQDLLQKNLTLTDAEREAVETASWEADAHQHTQRAATLRALLGRLGLH